MDRKNNYGGNYHQGGNKQGGNRNNNGGKQGGYGGYHH